MQVLITRVGQYLVKNRNIIFAGRPAASNIELAMNNTAGAGGFPQSPHFNVQSGL